MRQKPRSRRDNRLKANKVERQQHYFRAFTSVMTCYLELKSIIGTMSCEKFYLRLAGEQGGSGSKTKIKVSVDDLLADVELAVKETLNLKHTGDIPEMTFTNSEQELIGKEFLRRRIYPVTRYMRA